MSEPQQLPPHLIPGDDYDREFYRALVRKPRPPPRFDPATMRACPLCSSPTYRRGKFCIRCGGEIGVAAEGPEPALAPRPESESELESGAGRDSLLANPALARRYEERCRAAMLERAAEERRDWLDYGRIGGDVIDLDARQRNDRLRVNKEHHLAEVAAFKRFLDRIGGKD